jgi:hypothetical protein
MYKLWFYERERYHFRPEFYDIMYIYIYNYKNNIAIGALVAHATWNTFANRCMPINANGMA